MKIGDLLHWYNKPDLLAICIGIERSRSVVIVKWVNPERKGRDVSHAYIHNFKKVKTE